MLSSRDFLAHSALVALSLLSLSSTVSAQTKCNGYEEFCSRSYSNVSVVGAHNSYSVSAGSIAANQNYTVTTQLNDGIRMLQVQGHMNGNDLHLCHTSCALLDAGTFTSYLEEVASWLSSNPNEVVTLLLVNTDGIAPSVWAESYAAAGLVNQSYTPSTVPIAYADWPTLQTLISAGTRLVSFLAQNADVSSVPYLLDEFTNIWETPYDETDNSFPCTVDRVTGDYTGKMYLVNHFLDVNVTLLGEVIPVPDTASLTTTNGLSGTGSLTTQSSECYSQYGYYPTFTLVDYYDVPAGSVFEYAAQLNGVTYVASSSSSTTSTSSAKNTAVSSTSLSGASLQWNLSAIQALVATIVFGVTVTIAIF
ncbi:phospholipase C [Pseudohyphozyma bogoriensis]|nr:phospholipase C [Pseudohyphozyma bogoriensis]